MVKIINTITESKTVKIDGVEYVINPGYNEFPGMNQEKAENLIKNIHFLQFAMGKENTSPIMTQEVFNIVKKIEKENVFEEKSDKSVNFLSKMFRKMRKSEI